MAEPGAPSTEERLAELQAEVLRLHRKLEEFHVSDYNALRRAYASLSQHVAALEQESQGLLADLQRLETQPVPPEVVAQELGVAAAISFGVGLLHTTVRALPLKPAAGAVLAKGLWLLGGAVVLARLTGGTLAHMAGIFRRNAARKRRLQAKLAAVEERIHIMAALQQWAEKQAGPSAADAMEGRGGAAAAAAEPEPGWAVAPPRRISPTESTSSAEMVELPQAEELEAAEAGAASSAAADAGASGSSGASGSGDAGARAAAASGQQGQPRRGGGGSGSSASALQSLMAYAELGSRRK